MATTIASESAGAIDAGLPVDARDRVDLVQALVLAAHPMSLVQFGTVDDGVYVTVTVLLEEDDEALQEQLLALGGDVRCLDQEGRPLLEVRFYRDGRGDQGDVLVGPEDPWPAGVRVAVDLSHDELSPPRFLDLLDRLMRATEAGREVYLLNVPGHLRLFHELSDRSHPLPRREPVGPQLPEVLDELWG